MHNQRMLDWSNLQYFLAVAREGSTLAASKVLCVNQSTVHRRLAELEQHLGYPLVERHPTGYRLTNFGQELQPHAEKMEEAANALQRRVATFDKNVEGSVRLTCSTAVAYRLMKSKLLDIFRARHPGIRVELLMTERVLNLSKGEADIAIRGGGAKEEALIGKKIDNVPWAIYASRSYVGRHGNPARREDIQNHNIIEFIGDIANLAAARWLPSRAACSRGS
jgi:DNA-binding transcriptional LysR family regulator